MMWPTMNPASSVQSATTVSSIYLNPRCLPSEGSSTTVGACVPMSPKPNHSAGSSPGSPREPRHLLGRLLLGLESSGTSWSQCGAHVGSGSELKQNCTPTQDTVCHCKPGTQPLKDGYKYGVDCVPCPPGHFSPGNNQDCKPWTNCTSAGKRTLRPASTSSDSVCEDRSPLATTAWETHEPNARPTVVHPTEVWPHTSREPLTPASEAPVGPMLAAVLGLGLGLTAPLAALLALHLLRRAWKWPAVLKPSGGSSFRTPIQEEQADTHSTLVKV
ncbi:tumor necrosis factor receptor superfamily member 4 isoform X2 [Perognathus longimembris pacificus]|uniref:tumor necrosis factor receptor superfamily member 4 isoform X2 n=1 Tax=Perognathus longimembris pacificus TaxID=214514 RepID=UPI0020186DFF|nr:tumor necrosis factor receptor superfamily member 4 isoform X2 [Perognathus longimembris pacificus]